MNETNKIAIALECAAKYRETGGNDLMNAVAELRRLAAVERELEALKASIGEPAAVHQYQLASGAWIDQDEDSNAYNVKHGQAKVRTLYAITKDKP